ncbi:MAG TPA: RDD family protein [Bryobacteraceae bacterium]|nr:RDD family protein [Bryobacteraceae bacterium]
MRRPRPAAEQQENFDFRSVKAKQKTLATTVDAVISCDDKVAARGHRAVAAAFDWSMVALGFVAFLAAFRVCVAIWGSSSAITFNRPTLLALAGAFAVIAAAYGLLPAVMGSETAGMRMAGLRLVTFRGFPPQRKERMLRCIGSALSSCLLVGLAWSLWDEESLTWPDHISGTFPTALITKSKVFHRG